jgi:hypothetical protein
MHKRSREEEQYFNSSSLTTIKVERGGLGEAPHGSAGGDRTLPLLVSTLLLGKSTK